MELQTSIPTVQHAEEADLRSEMTRIAGRSLAASPRLMKQQVERHLLARHRSIGNMVTGMRTVPSSIQKRQIQHFTNADPAYGAGVALGTRWNSPLCSKVLGDLRFCPTHQLLELDQRWRG